MARTSYTGYLRQYGGPSKRNNTPAVFPSIIQMSIDISQASTTATGKFLPVGAIPIGAQNISGNGTATSTIDIGVTGTVDAFANELPGDAVSAMVVTGTTLGTALTASTEITAGAGAVGGTGTVLLAVYYIMQDDGSEGS